MSEESFCIKGFLFNSFLTILSFIGSFWLVTRFEGTWDSTSNTARSENMTAQFSNQVPSALHSHTNSNLPGSNCTLSFSESLDEMSVENCIPLHRQDDVLLEANSDEQTKRQVLIRVSISPESRVKASVIEKAPRLTQQQWTECVIEIENAAGVMSLLQLESDQFMGQSGDDADRWLQANWQSSQRLTGAPIESRTLKLWSREAGKRAAVITFNVGQGTQDLGFRSDALLVFDVVPAN